MKRQTILLTFAAIAAVFTSCGNGSGGNLEPNEKVIKFFKENVDYFISAKSEQPTLYYFGEAIHSSFKKFVKIDLETFEREVVKTVYNKEKNKEYSVDMVEVILPKEKGYDGECNFTIVTPRTAFIYNAEGEYVEKVICDNVEGMPLKTRSGIIAYGVPTQDNTPSIADIIICDEQGNELEPKKYEGTIAGKQVVVEIYERNGTLFGSQYQIKNGPDKLRLLWDGRIYDTREFSIYTYSTYGCVADHLTGTIQDGKIVGKHKLAYGHRKSDFVLTEIK